jgi:hypothetical protein
VSRDLTDAATGEQGQKRLVGWDTVLLEELGFGSTGASCPGERVSYICGRNSVPGEVCFFKRKNAEHASEVAPHLPHAPFAPCPYLGRDQVDNGNTEAPEFARDPQIEIWTVGEDRNVGPFRLCCPNQLAELPVDAWDVVDHFDQSDDGEASRIYDLADSGRSHARTCTAKEVSGGIQASKRCN